MLLRDAWLRARDRWLSSGQFQSWASAFPLTRPIARRHASACFDLCAGFVYSQILLACVRLQLFEKLRAGALPLSQLAALCALPVPAMRQLLEAAATLDLVEWRGGQPADPRFGLGSRGAVLLGNPALQAMIEHHSLLYADLQDPLALLRGSAGETRLGKFWAYAGSSPDAALGDGATEAYSELMSRSQPLVSDAILSACDLRSHRKLLDIGGGEGGFLLAAAARAPRLQGLLFDLPPVCARAAARFARSEASDRLHCCPGDFRTDPLPEGADIVSLIRVIHDHDDATVLALLRAIRAILPASGQLLIAEPLRATPGAERMGDAYFGFYLLAMGQGQPRSRSQLAELLECAGFGKPEELATPVPLQTRVLLARSSTVKNT